MSKRDMTDDEAVAHVRLGRAIDARRRELGLSRKQAAAATSMHPNYYNTLVRGEISPTYRTLLRIAAGLDMAPEQLVALAQEDPPDAADD